MDVSLIEAVWVFYQSNNIGGGDFWDLYMGMIGFELFALVPQLELYGEAWKGRGLGVKTDFSVLSLLTLLLIPTLPSIQEEST